MEAWIIALIALVILIIVIVVGVVLWLVLSGPDEEDLKPPGPDTPAKPPVDPPSDSDESDDEDDTPVRPDDPTYPEGAPPDGTVEEYPSENGFITTYVVRDRALMIPGGVFIKTVDGISVSPSTSRENSYGFQTSLDPSYEWSIFGLRLWSNHYSSAVVQALGSPSKSGGLTGLFLTIRNEDPLQEVIYDKRVITFRPRSDEKSILQGFYTSNNLSLYGVVPLTKTELSKIPSTKATFEVKIGGKSHTSRNIAGFGLYFNYLDYITIAQNYNHFSLNGSPQMVWNSVKGRIICSYGMVLQIHPNGNGTDRYVEIVLSPYEEGNNRQEAYVIGDLIIFPGLASNGGMAYYLYKFFVRENKTGLEAFGFNAADLKPDLIYLNNDKVIAKIK